MKRIAKHAATNITFSGLTGGINIAQSPEQIGETEMQECENFIYDQNSKRLVGRGGLSPNKLYSFDSDIKELSYDVGTNTVMSFLEDKSTFSIIDGAKAVNIGSMTGDSIPTTAKFQNKLWIASGAKLQFYAFDDKGIQTVTDSPLCDICFQRFARLFLTKTGDDNAYFSGIGDGAYWKEDTNDASTKQWTEIGYGDDGDIIGVVPLATDLMFLKSSGKIYQLVGDSTPDSWQINMVASDVDPIGLQCATNIGSSVVFLSMQGLRGLATVQDYGNIAAQDIGDNFNSLITTSMVSNPRVFKLKRHRMILIRPTSDYRYFIAYNYLLGVATVLRFGVPITSIIETANEIWVASGKNIYKWDKAYTKDADMAINYKMKPRDVIGSNELLVKALDTKFTSDHAGIATVSIGKLSVNVPTNSRKKLRCNHSTDCISLEVTSNNRFELDHIAIEVADL